MKARVETASGHPEAEPAQGGEDGKDDSAAAGRPPAAGTAGTREPVTRLPQSAPRMPLASINDVARLAGVSSQTVSRALNAHPNVRPSTRTRVLAAAAQLQFRPNRAARVLRGGRSHTLGVLAVAVGAHYGTAMSIAAFEEAARERDYGVIVVRAASASRQAVAAAVRELLGHNVDGALVVAPGASSVPGLPELLAHLPVVAPQCGPQYPASVLAASTSAPSTPALSPSAASTSALSTSAPSTSALSASALSASALSTSALSTSAPSTSAPSTSALSASALWPSAPSIDQRAGVRVLIGHFIALGHRRVLHLAGPPGWDDAESRLRAQETELRLAGLPSLPPLFGDWTAASGYAAGRALLGGRTGQDGRDLGFSAVFAANDQMALGLVRALYEAGIGVPRDVSVAGFDDMPQAAYFWPPLTTVRQDFGELGRRCVAALLGGDHGQAGAADAPAIEPLLVVRNSVATAPPWA